VGILSTCPSNSAILWGIAISSSFIEKDKVDNLINGAWDKDDVLDLEDDDILGLKKNCNDLEQIFIAETTDVEALKPCTLGEACHCLDWVQWEQAIEKEIAMLKAAGT